MSQADNDVTRPPYSQIWNIFLHWHMTHGNKPGLTLCQLTCSHYSSKSEHEAMMAVNRIMQPTDFAKWSNCLTSFCTSLLSPLSSLQSLSTHYLLVSPQSSLVSRMTCSLQPGITPCRPVSMVASLHADLCQWEYRMCRQPGIKMVRDRIKSCGQQSDNFLSGDHLRSDCVLLSLAGPGDRYQMSI